MVAPTPPAPFTLRSVAQIRAQAVEHEQATGEAGQKFIEVQAKVDTLIGRIQTVNLSTKVPTHLARKIWKELSEVKMAQMQLRFIPELRSAYRQECEMLLSALKAKVAADISNRFEQQGKGDGQAYWVNLPNSAVTQAVNKALGYEKVGKNGPASFLNRL